ncbi:MAG TPA: gephyrin-like molybdotransferase Glp [Solirubrobacterales bacterium]|jgi:molybdopterin molybdotransferase
MLKPSLVTVEEARAAVLADLEPLPSEPVPIELALGRVIAEGISASAPVPPFDNSAMDGYALRAADAAGASVEMPVELPLAGESRAGHPWTGSVGAGEAIAISTGAALPAGADCVVRLEDTGRSDGRVAILRAPETGLNVRRAGEDLREGEIALEAGTVLGPAELGVIASVGRSEVSCHRRPTVSVLVTGDELTAPGAALAPGQIHDTNSHTVSSLALLAGGSVIVVERVEDEPGAVRAALERALAADLALVCGGVSVGPHDHVRPALAEVGVSERFWGVALRPGKPTWFGVHDGGLAFGLPGNPVSAMVTFLLFARPALLGMAGVSPDPLRTTAILDGRYSKRPGRAHAVRCRLELADDGWHARPTKQQGSHVLSSMLGADCLALLPTDAEELEAGARVEIEILPETPLAGEAPAR